jgi:hypothetical protein
MCCIYNTAEDSIVKDTFQQLQNSYSLAFDRNYKKLTKKKWCVCVGGEDQQRENRLKLGVRPEYSLGQKADCLMHSLKRLEEEQTA